MRWPFSAGLNDHAGAKQFLNGLGTAESVSGKYRNTAERFATDSPF
ncbi:MAG: hypothetical protein ACI9TI_001825 [Natronomonas sp.]|jgi:hypothetical protein